MTDPPPEPTKDQSQTQDLNPNQEDLLARMGYSKAFKANPPITLEKDDNHRLFQYDVRTQPKTNIDAQYSLKVFQRRLLENKTAPDQPLDYSQKLQYQIENGTKFGEIYSQETFLEPLPIGKTMYHNGYLEYLIGAWYHDLGIEVSPWFLWNLLFKEFSEIVNQNPEKYRSVFTQSQEKIRLTQLDSFDIETFIAQLRGLVPTDMSKFFPAFSNPPKNYTHSMYGLFGATVQKYYESWIMGCSLPKLRLLGTLADWELLVETINNLLEIVAKLESVEIPSKPELPKLEPKNKGYAHYDGSNGFDAIQEIEGSNDFKYLLKCLWKAQEMITNLDNPDYWSKFVYTDRCGSGGEQGVRGHIMAFLPIDYEMTTYDLRKTISRYPYKDQLGNEYNFISGIMFSQLDPEGILVPEYHCGTTRWELLNQPLPLEESEHMKITLRVLEILDKYNLENVYKEVESQASDLDDGEGKVPDCVWFKKPSKNSSYYYGDREFEKKLTRDGFLLTPELRATVLSQDDVKALGEHILTAYNLLASTGGLDLKFFMKCLFTFDLSVIKASLEAYISHPQPLSYQNGDEFQRRQITTPEALIERLIATLSSHDYLDKAIKTELINGLLMAFESYKDQIKAVLAERIYGEINWQVMYMALYAKQVTDYYELPPVDLYELVKEPTNK